MSERSGERLLEGYYKELPIIADGDNVIYRRWMEDGKRDVIGLDLAIECIQVNGGARLIEEAFWQIVEITVRQGVLPRIIEIDRLGNPVERSQN